MFYATITCNCQFKTSELKKVDRLMEQTIQVPLELTGNLHLCTNLRLTFLAPVVRKVDSAIHWINYYPLDSAIGCRNTYPLDSDLSGG